MIRVIIFLCLLFPCIAHAQYNNGIDIWSERQAYTYMLKLITEKNGQLSDTCKPIFYKPVKDIYILKRNYIGNQPDTMNGYTIHMVDADSNHTSLYKEQKEKGIQIFYFDKSYNASTNYQYWIFPVIMTKKEVTYANRAYQFFFFYHTENSKFEFLRTGCISWK